MNRFLRAVDAEVEVGGTTGFVTFHIHYDLDAEVPSFVWRALQRTGALVPVVDPYPDGCSIELVDPNGRYPTFPSPRNGVTIRHNHCRPFR